MIELKNVTHTYMKGGPFEFTALRNVSLTIPDGAFAGIIGHTGSGKSTLIQMFNGLITPTEGQVLIDGEDITKKGANLRAVRFKVGLVMQYPEYQLFEETVYKDVAFGPKNMGLDAAEIERRVTDALDIVGLPKKYTHSSAFDLSGGQKRRVAIAGILAMNPGILVLDEPASGLDPAGREEIFKNIRDMREKRKITVTLVSHSMEDIARMAEHIFVINHGELALQGSPSEIFTKTDELTQMGLDVPQVTKVMKILSARGAAVPDGIYTVEQARDALTNLL